MQKKYMNNYNYHTSMPFFYVSGGILASLPLLGLLRVQIIREITKLPCCKRLLHSYEEHEHNDIADYDQDIELRKP